MSEPPPPTESLAAETQVDLKRDIGLYRAKYWLRSLLRLIPGIQKLNPNHLSMLAFLPGLLAAWFLFTNQWIAAIVAIALRMVCNTLDGLVAEEYNKKTHLGAYLNRIPGEITDILIVLALFPFAPLTMMFSYSYPTGLILIILVAWVQLFGVLGLTGGGSTQSVGPSGQTDRLIVIMIGALLCAIGEVSKVAWLEPSDVWFWLINLLCIGSIITIGLRIQNTVDELSARDTPPAADSPEEDLQA